MAQTIGIHFFLKKFGNKSENKKQKLQTECDQINGN